MTQNSYQPSGDFQDRLARIANGQTLSTDGIVHTPRKEAPDVKLTGGLMENALYPLSLIGAFFLGIMSVFFARFSRVHLLGTADPETDLMLALVADGAIALAIGFVFKQGFKLEGAEWAAAQTFGVTVMVAGMHNLVHLNPMLFALIFTPDWVDLTLSYTELRSLQIGGSMIPF